MIPTARDWLAAAIAILAHSTLLALCDPTPAAVPIRSQETTMPQLRPSHGPFTYQRPGTSGYTTIYDHEGRMIGAATHCAAGNATPLNDEEVAANGRLFASSHALCAALTAYMNAVDKAIVEGFTEDVLAEIEDARTDAHTAFDILLGKAKS